MSTVDADAVTGIDFEAEVAATQRYFDSPRFTGITRLYTARQVVEQRGTIPVDYTVARQTSAAFHARLRELFGQHRSITTFGPYSPGQAVAMKRCGIEGIYLGGWATSAKGSVTVSATGEFSYTPTSDALTAATNPGATAADKQDTFTVTVDDGYGGTTAVAVVAGCAESTTPRPRRWSSMPRDARDSRPRCAASRSLS